MSRRKTIERKFWWRWWRPYLLHVRPYQGGFKHRLADLVSRAACSLDDDAYETARAIWRS